MRAYTVLLIGLSWSVPLFGQGQGQQQDQVCIPIVADGNLGPLGWRSTIVVQNQEQRQSQVRLQFYNAGGEPMQMMLRSGGGQGQGHQVGPDGGFGADPMGAGAGRSYRSRGGFGLQSGYCLVQSPDRIEAHARLHLRDGAGNMLGETSIIPGPRFGSGRFFADQTEGQGVAFAFANPDPDLMNSCTVELFEEEGTEPVGSVDVEIGPRSQIGQFLFDMFPGLLTGDVGFVRVTCDDPICGVALQLRGLQMLQIPIVVEIEEEAP